MKIINLTCPKCGANLKTTETGGRAFCEYCGAEVILDDEKVHVQYDNAEEAGYSFEKGRQRAIAETAAVAHQPQKAVSSPGKEKVWLWILGFIFCFPIPLTILIFRSKKLSKKAKIIITAILWLLVLILGITSSANKTNDPANQDNVTRSATEQSGSNDGAEATAVPIIEAEAIELTSETDSLILGQSINLAVTFTPSDVANKELSWSSSDETVATVENGKVTAVGGGTATISASTSNGITAEYAVTVDGTKRIMQLRITNSRLDENNIGDEWCYLYEINGTQVSNGAYEIAVGDQLEIHVKITESDVNPDIGEKTLRHTVSESDIADGFELSIELFVAENGGRNNGQEAHFIIKMFFDTAK